MWSIWILFIKVPLRPFHNKNLCLPSCWNPLNKTMRGFREQSPKRKNKWYQNPQPTQKCGTNYIHTHINYIHAYTNISQLTKMIGIPGRSLSPASAFAASYGWPPGRGRSFEVGTSKLRLFAKVGLRMGLAITCHPTHNSGWWFQPIWKILVKLDIFPK